MLQDNDSTASRVEGAVVCVISPILGSDKKKMIKELKSIFGSDGKNVIFKDDIPEVNLPFSCMDRSWISDFDKTFESIETYNRGRNGHIKTIFSKKGFDKLSHHPRDDHGQIITNNGWRISNLDKDLAGLLVESEINKVLSCLPAYFRQLGREDAKVGGVNNQCPGCDNRITDNWYTPQLSEGQLKCGNCHYVHKAVDLKWAQKTLKEIQVYEEENQISILPKEMKAA